MKRLVEPTDAPDWPDPEPISVAAGLAVVLPRTRVGWLVQKGSAELYLVSHTGRDLLAVVRSGASVLPLAEDASATLRLVALDDLHLIPVAPGDRRFGDLVADWMTRLASLEESGDGGARAPDPVPAGSGAEAFVAAQARVAAVAEAFERRRGDAEAEVLSRLHAATRPGEDLSDRTAIALATVAAALGVGIDRRAVIASSADPEVPALCRRVGLRGRKILLEAGWHRRDQGHLLVRRSRDKGDAANGLDALIWDGRGYRGSDGRRLRARDAVAFDHVAHTVSAPLPVDVTSFSSLVRFILQSSSRRDGVTAALAGLIMAGLGALMPLAIAWLLSDIVPSGDAGLLIAVGVALAVSVVFSTVLKTAQQLAITRLAGRGAVVLHAAVTDRLLRLPASFFKGFSPGDLNQRLSHLEEIRDLVVSVLFHAVLTAILSIVYLVVLLVYDARLALIGVALVAVYAVAVVIARLLQITPLREAAACDGEVSALTYETLDGVAKLRSAAAEDRATARWLDAYRRERLARFAGARISVVFDAFADAYRTFTLMLLFAGAGALAAAEVPAGVFIGFLAAFAAFQAAFIGLSSALLELYATQPLMERARPILEAEPEVTTGGKDPGRLRGDIECAGLTFAYQPGIAPVLSGVNLKIRPGQHVAIVGGSGSGKSTLLRLLLGFETPQTGSVLYDGQELSHLDLMRVRGQIGVVLQHSDLFAGSILDNIRGASDAGLAECLDAVQKAGLAPDLEAFAMGIHTPITEGAGSLSGGQRQRILIARALAATPTILFFDEATSALDNATQAVVSETLDRLDVTRVTIAHRLSTVRHADRICVLQDGKIVEEGPFDALMAQDGAFAALARRQLTKG